jgi:hypothetical protein
MGFRSSLALVASLSLIGAAFAQVGTTVTEVAAASTAALGNLQAEHPGVQVYREGVHVSRLYGVPFGNGFTPEQSAVSFVNQYSDIFEPGLASLVYVDSQDVMDGKFTAVYFAQVVNGLVVDGARLTILVKNTVGSPIVLASSSVSTVTSIQRAFRQLSATDAQKIVKRLRPHLSPDGTPVMVAWNGETTTHYAWSFSVDKGTRVDPERYRVFVDATTGSVLEWRNEVFFTDVNGSVKAMATPGLLPNQANNPPVLMNLADVTARISGGNTARTNSLGNFTITHPGTTAVNVDSVLVGTWANVINDTGANSIPLVNVTPPGPANLVHNSAPVGTVQSQVDGFIHTQIIHNFAKAINGAYPGIDIAIPVHVNLASTCNAFYSASTINFYAAGGGCPNTAYSTVVYHEYGHFIIDMGHNSPTGDYHEGIADVTASLAANDPCLGRDFSGQGTGCLRNTYNSVVHPCGGGSHLCGQVISGAFWLTKDQLDITMGAGPALTHIRSLYLNSILLQPDDINPGVTIDVLTLDDNDANLNNGTPHYNEIATGFGAKNLDAPELIWLTITPANVPGEFFNLNSNFRSIPVSVNISNNVGTLDPSSPRLVFRVNGGAWQERQMFSLSPSAPKTSYLLVEPAGTVVEWYVRAKDTQNHTVVWPVGDARVTMFGNSLTTVFNDTFEAALGWTVTNENGLTLGAWTLANPNGTSQNGQQCNPENDSSDAGANCAFTGQGTVGGAVGAQDVDGGPTRYTSPVFDLSGGNGVIDMQRWFYNDDGDDSMTIELSNNGGASWTIVKTFMFTGIENSWAQTSIIVGNVMPRTNNMRIRVSTSDNPNNSITEAGIDAVRVRKLQ